MIAAAVALSVLALFAQTPEGGVDVKADPTGNPIDTKNSTQTYMVDTEGGVQFYIDLKDELFDTGQTMFYTHDVCGQKCRGKKFLSHKECNDSCDLACTKIHQG